VAAAPPCQGIPRGTQEISDSRARARFSLAAVPQRVQKRTADWTACDRTAVGAASSLSERQGCMGAVGVGRSAAWAHAALAGLRIWARIFIARSASERWSRAKRSREVQPSSTLSLSSRNEGRRNVLDVRAAAPRARRLRSSVLRDMFRMLERLTTLFTTVLIGGHGFPSRRLVDGALRTRLESKRHRIGFSL